MNDKYQLRDFIHIRHKNTKKNLTSISYEFYQPRAPNIIEHFLIVFSKGMRQQFQYPWKQKQKHFIIREITLGKYSFQEYSCHKICLYIYFVKPPAQWLSKSNGHSKSFVYRTFFILFQSNSILSSVPLRFICLPPSMHYFNTFPLNKPILLSQFP